MSSETVLVLAGLFVAEVLVLVGYLGLTSTQLTAVRYALYPFVWINAGVVAVWRTRPAPASERRRSIAVVIGVAYLGILAVAGGLVGFGAGAPVGVSVLTNGSPGYAPTLVLGTDVLTLRLVPYRVIGYLALAYLVYATVLDAAGSAISGVVGLFSCVSCTWPVAASVASSLVGALGGSAAAAAVSAYSLDISLVVFLSAVALLYWRPGFGD
jgi:hypothetical protein